MFTPIHTFAGGLLLHVSTASLLDNTGRVFGGSSILYEAIYGDHAFWRWALLGGMLVAPKLNAAIQPLAALLRVHLPTGIIEPVPEVDWSLAKLIIAGSLVGFGSKLGSGCTSGHFLCGVSRLSPRSLVATMSFFSIAVVTAFLSASTTGPSLSSKVIPSYTPVYPATSSEWTTVLALPLIHFAIHYLISRLRPSTMKTRLVALFSGITFATGLQLSGMARPIKVLRFLHLPIPGVFNVAEWDPSLFMVVLGGIVPNAIHYRFRVRPVLEEQDKKTDDVSVQGERKGAVAAIKYYLPNKLQSARIDARLLIGAAIFGLGWGMTGTCLLPSVVNAGNALFGLTERPGSAVAFMGAVIAGLGIGGLV